MADAMHEAMLDARQEGGSYRRIEVITGQRRRRHWTAEREGRIAAESFVSSMKASILLRREEVFAGMIALQLLSLIRCQPVSCDDFFPLFAEENVRLGALVHAQIRPLHAVA
jgi:hypothetical protein